jgi:hypothetical protein
MLKGMVLSSGFVQVNAERVLSNLNETLVNFDGRNTMERKRKVEASKILDSRRADG